MHAVKAIRQRLGATQTEIADAIGVSQSNVSFIEKGQEIQPEAAKLLVRFARDRQLEIGLDHVYGEVELPAPPQAPDRRQTDRRSPEPTQPEGGQ